MPPPTQEKWKEVEEQFQILWNYPNCIGALDGKHVVFEKPRKSGFLYFNYKKEFSIVLLALADANCKFLTVDVGAYGRNNDGGVFRSSKLGKALQNNSLNIPAPKKLPQSNVVVPHVFVCDEPFAMTTNTMRPFPGSALTNNNANKVYNYRHCRARRVVENAFGMLAKNFRIYSRKFNISPDHMDDIILATTVLHNYLKDDNCAWQSGELETPEISEGYTSVQGVGGYNPRAAFQI